MIKSLKQYLSLRGLLARRLRAKRKKVEQLGNLPDKCSDLEKCLAYANKNNNIKSMNVFYFSYTTGRNEYNQKVEFRNLGQTEFKNFQHLIELNLVSEQLKQLKAYD